MASVIYNRFLANLSNKIVDLEADDIKCAILDNTHVADKDDDVWTDVSGDEVSGTNYPAGGSSLTTKSVTQDDANDRMDYDADNVTFANVTFTNGRFAVLYDATLGTDDLIAVFDFGADKNPAGDDFTVQWDAAGILRMLQP